MILLENFELKEMAHCDLDLVLKWRNQEFIRNVMYNTEIISTDEHLKWYKKMKIDNTKKTLLFYSDGIPYGILQLQKINQNNKTCEWGFYIGNSNAPKGFGTILGYISLQYIFNELELRKVIGEVLSFNENSLQFHKKLGFIQEGVLRSQIIKENQLFDVYIFGLLLTEWKENESKIKYKIEGKFK